MRQRSQTAYYDFKNIVYVFISNAYEIRLKKLTKDMLNYLESYNRTHGTDFVSLFIPKRGYLRPGELLDSLIKEGLHFYKNGVQAHVLLKNEPEDKTNLYERIISLDDELKFIKKEYCYLSNKYGKEPYDLMISLLPKLLLQRFYWLEAKYTYQLDEEDKPNYEKFFNYLQINLVQSRVIG